MQTPRTNLERRAFLVGMLSLGFALHHAVAVESKKPTAQPPASNSNASNAKASQQKSPLTAADLKKVINDRLAKNPYYSPGFLIAHSDVEPIFNFLLERGVTIADDHEALYDSILPNNAQLVRLLKTPLGREFQKKLAGNAEAYHRLERLSWSPDGRKVLEELLRAKDGPARFQKLTAAELAKMSKNLATDPRTEDFNLPTGNIHTEAELLQYLEKALEARKAQ
jgi:hypothetical protein